MSAALTKTQNPPAVSVVDLTVAIGQTVVLQDINLNVDSGQTVVLLGGNGSGKTTLLRGILGLLPHQAGQVRLFGQPLADFRQWVRIGYVPQHGAVNIGAATIEEIVASGRLPHRRPFHGLNHNDRQAISGALSTVHLSHLANQPMGNLSGGQRQRALIARALATQPDLVILDEPMAGLDTASQDDLAEVLQVLKANGKAILIVLHELGPMEPLLDSCTVLKSGQVIYTGPLQSGQTSSGHHHPTQMADSFSDLTTSILSSDFPSRFTTPYQRLNHGSD